jgi:DNA-binding NarL/FixJ family response regulator
VVEAKLAASEARSTISCVVADDHPAIVEAVAALLGSEGIDVVARASDGAAALEAIEELRPTTAVLAIDLPRLSGIEVARAVSRSSPETGTILYTAHSEHQLLVEALDVGVRGFVLKETPLGELARAVKLVAGGGTYVDPVLAPMLVRAGAVGSHAPLSAREREILRHLADGETNEEIAKALFISPDTVRTYLRRAMEKLEADTRTQAVAIALRQSFIS